MKLNRRELRTVLFALHLASESESAFIDCHRKPHFGGKVSYFDPATVRKSRSAIARFRRLADKIRSTIKESE